jgi:hypothetical protein
MNFFDGLLVGASCALLGVGVIQWFSSRASQPARRNVPTGGGATIQIEKNKLNGIGLLCLSSQTVITLLFGAIYSEAHTHYGLELVIGWLASTLTLGIVFAALGTQSETISRE